MITIIDDAVCKMAAVHPPDPSQKRVLLSFTGVGHGMGGIDVQRPEFFGAGRAFDNVIFISDVTRSWGNALDFDLILENLRPYIDQKRVFMIGNSMGGFLSVLMSNFLETEACIAFVPQFSVSGKIVRFEHRWRNYRRHIKDFKYPSLEGRFNQSTRYYLFSGASWPDRKHWKRFPHQDNVQNIIIGKSAHNLAVELKSVGKLPALISACFDGDFSLEWMTDTLGIPAKRA